ncbi:MAG: TolC family protein, partial [Candidatus Brocadiaceae bacterium]|nr:TolC family protein [Candidatus Brocadiaceae bacterium]
PAETPLILDPAELSRLTEEGDLAIPLSAERIQELAMAHRLDLLTSGNRVEDAERRLEVTANDLLPGLDLRATMATDTAGNSPTNFQVSRTDYSVGFDLDLPLNKLAARNAFRRALIDVDRARRDHEELRDEVVLGVRSTWRQYERALRSHEIQKRSVELAETRLDSTQMLLKAGRVEARDVLDAQEALVGAQNDLAAALVDYRVARLELARDMDILDVGDRGELKESFDEYR